MKLRRQEFLADFLGALGAQTIDITLVQDEVIEGSVTYDLSNLDPKDKQDFRWRIKESDVPSQVAFDIVRIIHRDKLIDIDKLTVSEDILFSRLEGKFRKEEFKKGLEEILSIQVPMLDDGEETDAYFIHK